MSFWGHLIFRPLPNSIEVPMLYTPHLHAPQRKCRALLDAEGEHRIGERPDCGR